MRCSGFLATASEVADELCKNPVYARLGTSCHCGQPNPSAYPPSVKFEVEMLDGGVHFERQYQIATFMREGSRDSTRAADIDRDRARYLMAKLFEEALISAIASEEEEYGSY